MKKLKYIAYLFLILLISSCIQKGNSLIDEDNSIDKSNNKVSAIINGESFESIPNGAFAILYDLGDKKQLTISGGKEVSLTEIGSISITILHNSNISVSETTYEYNGDDCDSSQEVCSSFTYLQTSPPLAGVSTNDNGSFSITFSKLDYQLGGEVIGEFSGKTYSDNGDSLDITEGKFNLIIE